MDCTNGSTYIYVRYISLYVTGPAKINHVSADFVHLYSIITY